VDKPEDVVSGGQALPSMLMGMDLQRFSSASTCVTIAVCVTFDVSILSTVGTIDPRDISK